MTTTRKSTGVSLLADVPTTHVLTVHWQSPRWLVPQVRNLRRHLPGVRIWASLDGIAPSWDGHVDHTFRLSGNHAEKLNHLAARAVRLAEPDDRLLFIDGDAFPIAPVDADELLDGVVLAAVRRDENLGDRQPHPCFCLTTVQDWVDIGGDWREGYLWVNDTGELVTDVGGELLGILESRSLPWRQLLRSNRWNPDALLFGVYDDLVYHHGAGFREDFTRLHDARRRSRRARTRRIVEHTPSGPARRVVASTTTRALRRVERATDTRRRALDQEIRGWIDDDRDLAAAFLSKRPLVRRLPAVITPRVSVRSFVGPAGIEPSTERS